MMWFTPLKGLKKSLSTLCQPKLVFILQSNPYLNSALEDKSVDWSKLEELLLGEPAHYLGWFHGGAQAAGEQDQQGGEQHTTLHCVEILQTGGFLELSKKILFCRFGSSTHVLWKCNDQISEHAKHLTLL